MEISSQDYLLESATQLEYPILDQLSEQLLSLWTVLRHSLLLLTIILWVEHVGGAYFATNLLD